MGDFVITLFILLIVLVLVGIYRIKRSKSSQVLNSNRYFPEVTINAMREEELINAIKGNSVNVSAEDAKEALKNRFGYSSNKIMKVIKVEL